ncbi:MAG TPA: hypothetical protein VMF14_00820 [Solirubrobacteraceae bacterium]|nr:hypothetical protein [Solirubrobacteraceae bacterium]
MSFGDDPTQGAAGPGDDPTQASVMGDVSGDPTQGGELGATAMEDPSQGAEGAGEDPTQGDEIGERPGEDPTA